MIAVRLDRAEFGIPVSEVREVLRVPPITRIPLPPPSVRGVVSVRGSILPVMDLGARLLGRPAAGEGLLVVVNDPSSAGEVALLVDAVGGLLASGQPAQAPPPEVEAALPAGWIAGVVTAAPDRLVTLLHLPPILDLSDSTDKERR